MAGFASHWTTAVLTMPRVADVWLRLPLLLALSSCSSGVTASPAGAPVDGLQALLQQPPQALPLPQQQRKLHGRFLHITGA